MCDRYCTQLMEHLRTIAMYMSSVGPRKMSKNHLIQVLATLTPWELHAPDVEAAIEVKKDIAYCIAPYN